MTREQWYWNVHRPQVVRNYAMAMGIGAGSSEDVQPEPVEIEPLCFTALEANSTVDMAFYNSSGTSLQTMLVRPEEHIQLQYKLNDGEWNDFDWSTWSIDMAKIGSTGFFHTATEKTLPNVGDKLYVRCGENGNQYISHIDGNQFNVFAITGSLTVSGNLQSLLSRTQKLDVPGNCFRGLFASDNSGIKLCDGVLKDASELNLGADSIGHHCYTGMFNCNNGNSMLSAGPQMPATQLAFSCYSSMFNNCKSLVVPMQLPALTLYNYCYAGMFVGCSSLTVAPTLSANTLVNNCYKDMFQNCTSLSNIEVHFTDWNNGNDTLFWLQNTSEQGGIFKCPEGLPVLYAASYIPSDKWQVVRI